MLPKGTAKERLERAYNNFMELMDDEGYCYYDSDVDSPPKPTWLEIVRTGENYELIVYAIPQEESREIANA